MDFEFFKTQELASAVGREIETFLDSQDNSHPFQFPAWMGAGRNDERENKYCAIGREQGEIRWFAHCGMIFPVGKWPLAPRVLTITRGPVCDDPDLTLRGLNKLVERSKQLGFASIRIAPEWVERPESTIGNALSRDGWQSLSDERGSLRLALHPTIEELLRSFRHDTKLHIRRSERDGVVIRAAKSEEDIQQFERVYFDMAKKKDFSSEEPGHLSHTLRWVVGEKDRGALMLAAVDTTSLGGVLVVRAGRRSWGVYSATVKDSRVAAGHLLQWSAIQWAKGHGCTEYDFGGHREGVNTGPASFKRGFCREAIRFVPNYTYRVNPQLCSFVDFVAKARSRWRKV